MKPSEILRGARELLSEPWRWTQHQYALNAAGRPVALDSDTAVCWCIAGAVFRVSGYATSSPGHGRVGADRALDLVNETLGMGLIPWQDAETRTHAEILDALDRASARAEESEKGDG